MLSSAKLLYIHVSARYKMQETSTLQKITINNFILKKVLLEREMDLFSVERENDANPYKETYVNEITIT